MVGLGSSANCGGPQPHTPLLMRLRGSTLGSVERSWKPEREETLHTLLVAGGRPAGIAGSWWRSPRVRQTVLLAIRPRLADMLPGAMCGLCLWVGAGGGGFCAQAWLWPGKLSIPSLNKMVRRLLPPELRTTLTFRPSL